MRASAARFGLASPAVLLLALFFVLPVVAVGIDAFREGTAAFGRVFAIPGIGGDLAGSLLLTLVASTVSTAIGLAVALHLSRLPQAARTALSFVIALPLTFSGLIVVIGLWEGQLLGLAVILTVGLFGGLLSRLFAFNAGVQFMGYYAAVLSVPAIIKLF